MLITPGEVLELADSLDLGSSAARLGGFKSPLPHLGNSLLFTPC